MTDSTLVLELLEDIKPRAYCDDCLSTELDIHPRQTVNQICRALYSAKRIGREKASCSHCGKVKITNTRVAEFVPSVVPLSPSAGGPGKLPSPLFTPTFDIEKARTEIVQICRRLWQRTQSGSPSHSISITINSLKSQGALPSHQANMMLTLCGLRNAHVYEDMALGSREIIIAETAREIVIDWWTKNNLGSVK